MAEVPGVKLFDQEMNGSHNRCVITLLGEPAPIAEAAFRGCARAKDLIDLRSHTGEHPRMGATDVIPFVPVEGVTMADCVALARQTGARIGSELGIPVFLYEAAATRPEHTNLADVRRGEFEGLSQMIGQDELHIPDFGPRAIHTTAGATAVGAREYLVAFNVNLSTTNVDIAKKIAKAIRESSGGYRNVKSIGLYLTEQNVAQVSINMCNYRETPLSRVFETIKSEAARYGVNIVGSEIVGLTPMRALIDAARFYLRLDGFKDVQVIEKRLLDDTMGEGK
jgi:glutamate formiminotransferase